VDNLCDAVHKSHYCLHRFVCPLITNNLWRKQRLKACAFRFMIKSVCDILPYTEHAPLGIFVVLPLNRHDSCNLWGTKPVADLGAALREVPYDH
jgi:hypothetical protein